jgi:fatty-acyl-CoA synthase
LTAVSDALQAWIRALDRTAPLAGSMGPTLPALIADVATVFGPQPALLSDAECLTYQALIERSTRYARWALQQGLGSGEVVCLLMENCPDYVATWLGITSIGSIVALINTNLAGDALVHAIAAAAPKHVIVDASLEAALAAVRDKLPAALQCWTHGQSDEWPRIELHIRDLSAQPLQAWERREPSLDDWALYIYTSGTTGLPKAAKISHRRVMEWSCWFAGMADTQSGDRMYNCLPLYHSVGGVVAIGAMLVNGGSVVIRQRFSASRFWDEIVEWDCTLFQYIGELCRYLVNTPVHPRETSHRLRLCCGNGLRGDIWEPFQQRFRIPRILEFYASTEGNLSLYNCEGRPGAIGRVPPFLAHRFPVALIRCDLDTGEPARDPAGLCIRCAKDEVGEALGKIGGDGSAHGRPFEGYTDTAASAGKVLRDVFVKGDAWFRTGDLMRRDGSGFYYFIDRLGDTFRWKSENVSTAEVADVLRACAGVSDAVVYGATVPGTEGRAGMAAVTPDRGFDLAVLRQHIEERLPDYARPLFVRVCTGISVTGTFKPIKSALAREGYDPGVVTDAVYFDDRSSRSFVPLGVALHERIRSGLLRL